MRKIQSTVDCVTLNNRNLKHITHDLYGIAERIRDIDSGYFIVRNLDKDRYEVHHVDSYPRTFQFVVPFKELDARTLKHCRMTMIANSARLLREMEKENERINAAMRKAATDEIESIAIDTATDLRRAI